MHDSQPVREDLNTKEIPRVYDMLENLVSFKL